ncbi:uncharacterized protein FFB14_06351 [Fusarium fujikuroi]|nr:uncharacterized protein FFB14_06351 [Fusarium fujikuroi]
MSSPQKPPEQNITDIFSILPPELNIKILDRASFPDMRRVISASPTLLNIFQQHRSYLLGHYLQELLAFYGDESILPLAAFTMNLRLLRSRCQQLTPSEVEESLRPAMNSILLLEFTRPPMAGYLNLPLIEKAQKLLPELCRVFEMYQDERAGWHQRIRTSSLGEEDSEDKFRYVERFLRFDCYRNIIYHQNQFLFDGIENIRNTFSHPFLLHPMFPDGWQHRDPCPGAFILDTLLSGHHSLLRRLDQSLASLQPQRLKKHEKWKRDVFPLRRNQWLEGEHWYYKLHLCMGGFPRLILLQSLTPEDFEHYTLEAFYQIFTAKPKPEDWSEQINSFMRLCTNWE